MDLMKTVDTLRVPFKSLAGVTAFLAVTAVVQIYALDRLLGPGEARRPVVLAVVIPLVACAACVGVAVTLLTRARSAALIAAFEKVARGDFDVSLPTPREPVLRAVRDAFARTTAAIAELTRNLSHADAQRRRLFSDLAHELATPSASILGLSDTLARPDLVANAGGQAALLAALEKEAERLARLVSDLRDLAVVEDPDISFAGETADVATLVRATVDRFTVIHPDCAPISLRVDATAVATLDSARVEQALINLLRNAMRHTPAGGAITIDVQAAGGWVIVSVENAGAPLPDEIFARLGERFFRGDPSRSASTGGLGLGLAIVRSIAHRHGGAIMFSAAGGGGLRAELRLPGK